jgi:hypothetical protein
VPRTRGNPLVKIAFVVGNAAHAEPKELWTGTCASPFFECGSTEREMRGGLISGEYFGHTAVSGKW